MEWREGGEEGRCRQHVRMDEEITVGGSRGDTCREAGD